MELQFLGRGSAFFPAMGNTSACFEKGRNLYLLDCGESVFERLLKQKDLKTYERVWVLLTHLHADHVGSLGSLISYNYCLFGRKIRVVHPEETVVDLLRLMGIKDEFYCFENNFPPENGLSITSVPVRHVDNMKCYGYLVEEEGSSFYYSGDAAEIPEMILRGLRDGWVNCIYQDTTGSGEAKANHCSVGELKRMIPEELRRKVYCMHLDEETENRLRKTGFQIAGPVL